MSNIEDDVKIIKRYLESSSYKESDSDFFKNGGWEIVDLEIPQAMSNILSEREQDKARIKELEEKNNEMKNLFRIQASIAKELDFKEEEKMIRVRGMYYVPDTMTITDNIGKPKRIELSYVDVTKLLGEL